MAGATSWTCVAPAHVQDVASAHVQDIALAIHDVAGHDVAVHVDDYLAHDAPPAGGSCSLDVICEYSSSESFVRDNPMYNPVSDSSTSHGSGSEVEMGEDFQSVPNLIIPGVETPWNDLKTMYDVMENDLEL
ncbi:hypothetical protein TIFTF001_003910 [Ficus carica]|uniref:Uncharacterized protein n=1 Tax=Ficus carica TaxID=3494 RepID=A0AA87ZJ34_FICCA|nr:hypothetical protein TIFTF001_003910 [Ficus carica]